jgi:hypothetical protein
MLKVVRPEAGEEHAGVLRLFRISSDLKQEKNTQVFFDLSSSHERYGRRMS